MPPLPPDPASGGAAGDVRLDAVVHGRVQGVGFRYFVLRVAAELGLRGWVGNEPDGSVRCVAEGSPAAIGRFEALLTAGPPSAEVDRVSASRGPATGAFGGFTIRSGGHSGD